MGSLLWLPGAGLVPVSISFLGKYWRGMPQGSGTYFPSQDVPAEPRVSVIVAAAATQFLCPLVCLAQKPNKGLVMAKGTAGLLRYPDESKG